MDDLIVIILTLIIGAIGALGQMKKKRAADQEINKQPPNPNDPMEEHHEYDFGFQTHHWPEEAREEIIPEEEIARETEVLEPPYRFMPGNEGESAIRDDLTQSKELKLEIKPRKRPFDFSLRKAIIYNEILNRKYE